MILSDDRERTLLIAINDLFADGTDVSWLWDVDFEQLEGRVKTVICASTRAEDMAVRLKYALVPGSSGRGRSRRTTRAPAAHRRIRTRRDRLRTADVYRHAGVARGAAAGRARRGLLAGLGHGSQFGAPDQRLTPTLDADAPVSRPYEHLR